VTEFIKNELLAHLVIQTQVLEVDVEEPITIIAFPSMLAAPDICFFNSSFLSINLKSMPRISLQSEIVTVVSSATSLLFWNLRI